MQIGVAAVGRLKDGPERALVARYLERARPLGRALGFSAIDMAEVPESRAIRARDRMVEEARDILARHAGTRLVALDERGQSRGSEAFAQDLARMRDAGQARLVFVIGGADGLDRAAFAGPSLSFGAMTLPHQLVRVLLAEQLYRAMTILRGHPYHRV